MSRLEYIDHLTERRKRYLTGIWQLESAGRGNDRNFVFLCFFEHLLRATEHAKV